MGLKTYAGLGAFVAVGAVVSQADKSMNYTPTSAVVTTSKIDCFVKDSKSQIIDKETGKLAYMDCDLAPIAAMMHDHDASDIQQRVKFKYAYYSPIDGSRQSGSKTKTDSSAGDFVKGYQFTIHAHKEELGKTRF